jgi:hypothetical protein
MTDPTLGIWIADDGTVGTPDPTNLYRFVGDNPVNAVDPTGLSSKDSTKGPNNAKKVMEILASDPSPRFSLLARYLY